MCIIFMSSVFPDLSGNEKELYTLRAARAKSAGQAASQVRSPPIARIRQHACSSSQSGSSAPPWAGASGLIHTGTSPADRAPSTS